MTRDLGAEVQPVVNVAKLLADAQRMQIQIADGERAIAHNTEVVAGYRLKLGQILVEARKGFPARGPKAAAWGRFIADIGISQRTAHNYMKLAGYVGEISETVSETSQATAGGKVSETDGENRSRVPTYHEAGSDKRPRAPKTPTPRVVRDASDGGEPPAEERTYREVVFLVEPAPAPEGTDIKIAVQVGDGPITAITTKAPSALVDQRGIAVPVALVEIFAKMPPRLRRIHSLLNEAAQEWESLEGELRAAKQAGAPFPPGHPFGPFGSSVQNAAGLRDLALSYHRAQPFTVCPTCRGTGEACADCRGAGWCDKARFDRALPGAKEASGS